MLSTRAIILVIIVGSIAALLPLIILSGIPNPVSSLIEDDNISNASDIPLELHSEPRVLSQDQNLYVVWSEEYAGNREIFFKRSPDNGQSFDQPINLSNNTSDSISPSLVVFENFVKVSWLEQLQSADNGRNFTNLQRTSTDYGLIFGATINLDSPPPRSASVDDARRSLIDDVFARSINSSQTILFIKSGGNYQDGQRQPSLRLDVAIPSTVSNDNLVSNNRIGFQYFAYVNDGSTIGSQCSDIRVHFYIDGVLQGSSEWVGYEGRNVPLPLDTGVIALENLSPGVQHTLTLVPEGRVGGCNVGWINAWGGFVVIYQ